SVGLVLTLTVGLKGQQDNEVAQQNATQTAVAHSTVVAVQTAVQDKTRQWGCPKSYQTIDVGKQTNTGLQGTLEMFFPCHNPQSQKGSDALMDALIYEQITNYQGVTSIQGSCEEMGAAYVHQGATINVLTGQNEAPRATLIEVTCPTNDEIP